MRHPLRPSLQMAILLGTAILCGTVANTLASPARRLGAQKAIPQARPAPPPRPSPATPAPGPAPEKPKPVFQAPKAPTMVPAIHFEWDPQQPTREIDSREASEAFRQGMPFLDARRSTEYQEGHIRGALAMPVWEADVEERLARFDALGHPLKAPVVIYCSGGDCHDSQLLASKLLGLGYRHLLIYREGYPDWLGQGRAITRGGQP